VISSANKPIEAIHYGSAVDFKINETAASTIILKRLLLVNCDMNVLQCLWYIGS
jgi:hypothetical protein